MKPSDILDTSNTVQRLSKIDEDIRSSRRKIPYSIQDRAEAAGESVHSLLETLDQETATVRAKVLQKCKTQGMKVQKGADSDRSSGPSENRIERTSRAPWTINRSEFAISFCLVSVLAYLSLKYFLDPGQAYVSFLLLLGGNIAISALRLRSIGTKAVLSIFAIVPVLNMLLLLACLILPPGFQEHRKLDSNSYISVTLLVLALIIMYSL